MSSYLDRIRAVSEGKEEPTAIMSALGLKIIRLGEGNITFAMKVDPRFYNPMGSLQAGIITTLADASMGTAALSVLKETEAFTTLEFKMNFIRPVFEGELQAEAKVVHRGRTIILVQCVVKNSEGKDVAMGMATQMVLAIGK